MLIALGMGRGPEPSVKEIQMSGFTIGIWVIAVVVVAAWPCGSSRSPARTGVPARSIPGVSRRAGSSRAASTPAASEVSRRTGTGRRRHGCGSRRAGLGV